MNRKFLILLMVGTAMIIAVIGQHEPQNQLNNMPWEIKHLDNGALKVFGVTLGKTSIHEANQIFSRFADTRLQVKNIDNKPTYQLLAHYNDLTIGGVLSHIVIVYQIEHTELKSIYDSLNISTDNSNINTLYSVSKKTETKHLNTAVAKIIYTPEIDFDLMMIRQRFGPPSDELKLNNDETILSYPKLGLKIYIAANIPDKFIYSPLQ